MYIAHPFHHIILKNIKSFTSVERMQFTSSSPFLKLCGLVTKQLLSITFILFPSPRPFYKSLSQFQLLQSPVPTASHFIPTTICNPITEHPKPGECSHNTMYYLVTWHWIPISSLYLNVVTWISISIQWMGECCILNVKQEGSKALWPRTLGFSVLLVVLIAHYNFGISHTVSRTLLPLELSCLWIPPPCSPSWSCWLDCPNPGSQLVLNSHAPSAWQDTPKPHVRLSDARC